MSPNLEEQLRLLPDYLSAHLVLSLSALAAGIAISVPLGILVTRTTSLRGPALTTASVVQTIPGLALLALMVPLLGRIGFLPAFIALVCYSVLPILRNTVTGLDGIDARVIEAARGIGMTPTQVLLRIRLPLAMPVIIAGIRTATVWTVGLAVLSTPVGATSLGNYIFSGLQTQNYTAVTVGCVVAAILAIVLDGLIRILELAASRRSLRLGGAAVAALAVIVLSGLYPTLAARRVDYVIGGKAFTEQIVLAHLLAAQLERRGIAVDVRTGLGSAVIFEATAQSNIDAYCEYSGTAWANHMKQTENPGKIPIREAVVEWLRDEHGMVTVGPFGFENLYALAMRRDRAAALGVTSIEDLIPLSPRLSLGSDMEFFSRPEWHKLRDTYGFDFRERRTFDASLMYAAVGEGQVDVITAYTTDGRIVSHDLVLLTDERNALLPYDGLIVISRQAAADPRFVAAMEPLVNAISSETMREANKMVDVDKKPVKEAVAFLLGVIDGE